MTRRYDSSKRRKAAEQTRKDILQAALKLHWEGVTELEPLAEEAQCSLATVRKHFPTKEALFRNCTETFGKTLTMPDMEKLSKIRDRRERLCRSVSELCRIHEAMFGYAWHSAHLRQNSPILEKVMNRYEELADAVAKGVTPKGSPRAATVRGLVDFLTYRALRLSGKLSPEEAKTEIVATVSALVGDPGDFVSIPSVRRSNRS